MQDTDRWDGSPGSDRRSDERVVIVRMWAEAGGAPVVRARVIEVDPETPYERSESCLGESAIVGAVEVAVRRFVTKIDPRRT